MLQKNFLWGMIFIAHFTLFLSCSKKSSQTYENPFQQKKIEIIKSETAPKKSDEFILAITPWAQTEDMKQIFAHFLDYLSEQIEKKVILKTTSDYGSLINEFINGNADMGFFSPGNYVKATTDCPDKIEYIATTIDRETLTPYYHGVLFVRKDSKIKTIRDLKGKLAAFVDEYSASGYLYPQALLIDKWKIDSEKFFKKIIFLGTHTNVVDAVKNGQADVGATWNRFYEKKNQDFGKELFKILDVTDKIPYDAVVLRAGSSPELKSKIKKALIEMNSEKMLKSGKFISGPFYVGGFTVLNQKFYKDLRKLSERFDRKKKEQRKKLEDLD